MTYVRKLLCQAVEQFPEAFTPEELLGELRKIDRQVALSSVYRTLRQLANADLLFCTSGVKGTHHYSIANAAFSAGTQVACLDCGKTIPVSNPCLGLRESEAAQKEGFRPRKITLRFEASCERFQQTGKCERAGGEIGEEENTVKD